MKKVIIYGAGDHGTYELRRRFLDKCSVEFKDIRVARGGSEHMRHLHRLNLDTVPQVFSEDGARIGGYGEALALLAKLPDLPRLSPRVA